MDPSPSLLDEHAAKDFRTRFGELATRSTSIDVAATRVRLSLVDLRPDELVDLRIMRVLLSEVNGMRMAAEAEAALGDPARTASLGLLTSLLDSGLITVRSAPLGGWAPDFSIFRRESVAFAALVGVHSFLRPSPFPGPLFVSEHGREGAALAGRRFQRLWDRSHDVGPALARLLRGVAESAQSAPRPRASSSGFEALEHQRDIAVQTRPEPVDTPRDP